MTTPNTPLADELRVHNEYDSMLTKVLMEQHLEWDMETVREAALICSNTLIPVFAKREREARINEWNLISETLHSANIAADLHLSKVRADRIKALEQEEK